MQTLAHVLLPAAPPTLYGSTYPDMTLNLLTVLAQLFSLSMALVLSVKKKGGKSSLDFMLAMFANFSQYYCEGKFLHAEYFSSFYEQIRTEHITPPHLVYNLAFMVNLFPMN